MNFRLSRGRRNGVVECLRLYRGFLPANRANGTGAPVGRQNDNFILLVGRIEMTILLMGFLPSVEMTTVISCADFIDDLNSLQLFLTNYFHPL